MIWSESERRCILNKQLELTGELYQKDARYISAQSPAMKGQCRIGDEIYYISAWNKKAADGKNYLKLLFKLAK